MRKKAGRKKNRRLLFQTSIVIILLFFLMSSATRNMLTISAFSTSLSNIYFTNRKNMETFPDYLETYKSLTWLIDRWMEDSGEIVSDKDPDEAGWLQTRMDKLAEEHGFGGFEEITPECAASLTADLPCLLLRV